MPSAACHSSPFAGSWYPGDAAAINALLDELWAGSERRLRVPSVPGALAFVVPHAGLAYSGRVAAAAFRHLAQESPRRVVILGFAHRGAPAGAWIPQIEAYRTPLGETPLDREAVTGLLDSGAFQSMPEEALCDHSVEIQLPLITRAAPDTAVVPIYVSALSGTERSRGARALAGVLERGTVVLASSDFTHYGAAFHYTPFRRDAAIAERLRTLDQGFLEAASSMEPDLFLAALDAESATVCGRQPIALLLETLSALPNGEDIFQSTLDYETSGDITGDYDHSVSYASLGYFPWDALQLTDEDARILLGSARQTLRRYQETGREEPIRADGNSPALDRRTGAFVTLRKMGELRGCVGRSSSDVSLSELIPEMTLAAALDDRRFEPVATDEPDIEIEVSVLSPMKRISDPGRFRVGRDGAYLRAGVHSGLLLPQVAEGRNWTASQFLDALARKAGAPKNVYRKPGTRLSVFRAQVIE